MKTKEPKINQIGKTVTVEFEDQENAEAFYKSLKLAAKLVRVMQEDADTP